MYRTAQQRKWDQQNVLDYAKEEAQAEGMAEGIAKGIAKGKVEGLEEGRKVGKKEVALEMLKSGIDIEVIATCSKLSIEEITALKYGNFN